MKILTALLPLLNGLRLCQTSCKVVPKYEMIGLNWVDTGECRFVSHKKKLQKKYDCTPHEIETVFIGKISSEIQPLTNHLLAGRRPIVTSSVQSCKCLKLSNDVIF